MDANIWKEIDAYAGRHGLIRPGDHILLALSGGADSVCLLRYLLWKRESDGILLSALHVNHMLRGDESDRDETFVKDLCDRLSVPLTIIRADIYRESRRRRLSVEEAGRQVRYERLKEEADRLCCDRIALAHHSDDQAETVLFRMIRGTGADGLAAMPAVSGRYIRPLLGLRREKIEDILGWLGQEYVNDSSNGEDAYARNYIRHHILPPMSELNPRAVEHICALADQMRLEKEYAQMLDERLFSSCARQDGEGIFVPEEAFASLHPYERMRLCTKIIRRASGTARDMGRIHASGLAELFDKEEGKLLALPGGISAVRISKGILVGPEDWVVRDRSTADPQPDMEIDCDSKGGEILLEPEGIRIQYRILPRDQITYRKSDCVKYFDYDRINRNLTLRSRRQGDYLVMDSSGSRKKLSRYFIDEKLPSDIRCQRILLADGSHILWVLGGRISEYYKISRETKRVLAVKAEGLKPFNSISIQED